MRSQTPHEIFHRHPYSVTIGVRWWTTAWFGSVVFLIHTAARSFLLASFVYLGFHPTLIPLPILVLLPLGLLLAPFAFWYTDRLIFELWCKCFTQRETRRALHSPNPILFLRSFAADNLRIQSEGISLERGDNLSTLVGLFLWSAIQRLGGWTTEQSVWSMLPTSTSMLAVGKPDDFVWRGAGTRVYIRGDWKQIVSELMDHASLIIIRLDKGAGTGLAWEQQQLAKKSLLSRSIFITVDDYGLPMRIRDTPLAANVGFCKSLDEKIYGYWFDRNRLIVLNRPKPSEYFGVRSEFEFAVANCLKQHSNMLKYAKQITNGSSLRRWFWWQWAISVYVCYNLLGPFDAVLDKFGAFGAVSAAGAYITGTIVAYVAKIVSERAPFDAT